MEVGMRNIMLKRRLWNARRPKLVMGITAGLVVGGIMTPAALALIPDSSGIIHACYNNKGDVRIIDSPAESCKNNETAISWSSSAGPSGPAGLGQLVTSDFSNANLEAFDLRYRDFHGINFNAANLSRALFSHTNVSGANF